LFNEQNLFGRPPQSQLCKGRLHQSEAGALRAFVTF
jgi:hypothetical protein